ncbi:hypothetical protein D3C77_527090 [compost metagenome]
MMFCHTMRRVLFAIWIAEASLEGSSVMITISAASMAASDPRPPMATPTSALAKTGVSLIPSPTNAIFSLLDFWRSIFSSSSTLCCGSSSDRTSSTPSFLPTASPTALISPVNMKTFFTPRFFSEWIACAESSLTSSAITK